MTEIKKAESNEPQLSLTKDDLSYLLSKVIEESKKPYVDANVEAQKVRNRERIRGERAEQEANRAAREAACAHMREDNTSAVAWMQNSDNIWRGVCQRCNALFTPSHPDYAALIRIPTRAIVSVG